MLDFLPVKIKSAISKLNIDKLYEIRLRKSFPISILYDGKKMYLTENGITLFESTSIICGNNEINDIINTITQHSVYAYNDQIKQGFLTTSKGVRIGICGHCVFDNDNIITIKDISSLLIRVPHFIDGCSNKILSFIINNKTINNTLIISPPGLGKTTLLKDIAIKLNNTTKFNLLVIDERGEFCDINGVNIDKISYSNKFFAFNYAVRSMSPEIIITDELANKNDWICAENIINSGMKIIGSCHSGNIIELKNKEYFQNIFDRYIVLDHIKIGQVKNIYDNNFNII